MQHRRNNLTTLVLLVVVALVLVACGGGDGETTEADTGVTIEVIQNDIYFGDSADNVDNPPTWTVPAGAEVTVEVTNQGALEHNWAVVEMGAEVPVPLDQTNAADILLYDTGLVDPGSSRTEVFTAPTEPGEYLVICTVAGHYPPMQGRLIVT